MEGLGLRIQELRKQSKLSIVELADNVGISKSQMIRYESKESRPPADTLNKLATTLGTSADYLLNGDTNEKASKTLKNTLLLQKFRDIEQLPEHEQGVILDVIAAYIRDFKNKQAFGLIK